uniref:Uncharacterized protein n=1 Tax=Leersia perrieri TaxID=77586 RepID=A0A0D9XNQ9_9ORYZ
MADSSNVGGQINPHLADILQWSELTGFADLLIASEVCCCFSHIKLKNSCVYKPITTFVRLWFCGDTAGIRD